MRSLIVSIAALGLVICIWAVYYSYSTTMLEDIGITCEDKIIPAIKEDDWQYAREEIKAQYKEWHKYRKTALYFLDTANVNSADAAFARALEFIDEEDASNARGELLALKEQMYSLKDNEKPSLSNIF